MLVKLFKQEMKAKGRVMLLIYEVLAAVTLLIVMVGIYNQHVQSRMSHIIYAVSGAVYLITIPVLVIIAFIYLCVSFYQSMYTAQGYLTHTLPVKTTSILNIKIAASLAHMMLTAAVVFVLAVISGLIIDRTVVYELWHMLGPAMQNVYEQTGVHGAVFIGSAVVMMFLGCLDALLLFFAGSSIGQLFHRSKGAWGIAAGISLYYMSQIISIFAAALLAAFLTEKYSGNLSDLVILSWMIPGTMAVLGFWAVVYYLISRVIVQKHLNLE